MKYVYDMADRLGNSPGQSAVFLSLCTKIMGKGRY